jgi:serine/threonine protein kinase/WD40 repeat protein
MYSPLRKKYEMSESIDSREVLLNQLADNLAARQRAGERPRLEDYCERHPDLAEDIRSLFPALIELEQAKEEIVPDLLGAFSDVPPVSQLGDFRLLREVGRGGMGVVYEAEQVSLGRRVAIKLLPASVFRDPTKRLRFEREAKSAAKLHHSNIVPVHGIGEHEGTPYYVMQFIPGLGLDAVIDELRRVPGTGRMSEPTRVLSRAATNMSVALARSLHGEFEARTPELKGLANHSPESHDTGRTRSSEGNSSVSRSNSAVHLPGQPLSAMDGTSVKKTTYWESVARIGVQVAGALSYAHKLGVLHRDIKPANLLLDLDAVVWVTDFGLAKAADDSDDLTNTGDILGTLRYMPPEAFEGKSDPRSDIYALGLTLFELVALRPAYDERDRNKLVKELTNGDPPQLRKYRKDAPRDLVTIIEKACDRNPARRYHSAAAMAIDLQLFLDGRPIIARRPSDLERLWMWSRRRPAMAGMVAALFLCLIAGTVVSTRFAFQAERFSRDAAARENEATNARDQADLSRLAELAQRKRADVMLADMYTARGLLAGDRDANAEAALWFTAAADQSATAEDSGRENDNRLRARNWLRQSTLPFAAIRLPTNIDQMEFQPHGNLLLTRFDDKVMLWSWRDGTRLPWTEKLNGIVSAQFSPDGQSLAFGFHSGEAQIRNAFNGKVLNTIPAGQAIVLSFSPDGKFLALADGVARVWDIERQAFLNSGWTHPQGVTAVAFNQAGDRLITAGFDQLARVFVVERGRERMEPLFKPVAHHVGSAPVLVNNDRELLTVTESQEFTRWEMATGKPAASPIRSTSSSIHHIVGSKDSKWLVAGGVSGPELLATHFQQPSIQLNHTNAVRNSAFSPDNSMLLTVSWDQTARIWSIPNGTPVGPPLKHMANVETCAWSSDNRHFATSQNDGLIRVWQLPLNDLGIVRETGWGMWKRPRVSFDGRLVVPGIWHESPMDSKSSQRRLQVQTTADGKSAAELSLPGGLVDSCVCTDNLAVGAVVERDGKGLFGVWDVLTAQSRFEPIPLPGIAYSVTARPGSSQLAVFCDTGDLYVFDDKSGKRVQALRHEGWLPTPGRSLHVQYSPDGKTLVSLSPVAPSTINVRDAEIGTLRFEPIRSTVAGSNINSFTVSADSRLLATMSLVKNHVQVWDLSTGRAVSEPLPHPGDFWGLFSVRFSPDGRHLLTSHKDGQLRYWDWQAAKLACPPMAHDNDVMDATVTPDGRFALSAIRGRPELNIWDLTTGRHVAPPIRLWPHESASTLTLDLTPDGRSALVRFLPTELALIDLDVVISPLSIPTGDLSRLAELTTARRIELGDLSSLTTEHWIEGWNQLMKRNPEVVRTLQLTSPRKNEFSN